ncbi:MAG: VWA domain-containing protein [Clostridia bacterium]|nr:VWA domain-containing protein [Clostridia bacterium]
MKVSEITMLTKALSEKKNVRAMLSFDGRAYAGFKSGKYTIHIPVPDDNSHSQLVHGYIDHETGHVKWTDFDKLQELYRDEHTLANIYEDEMVERKMGEIFPGCRENLEALAKSVFDCKMPVYIKDTVKKYKRNPRMDIIEIVDYALLYIRRARLVKEFQSHANAMRKVLYAIFKGERKELDELLDASCDCTEDSVRCARELYALICMRFNEDVAQNNSQQNTGEDGNQDSDNQGDSGESGGASGETDSTGDSELDEALNEAQGEEQPGYGLGIFSSDIGNALSNRFSEELKTYDTEKKMEIEEFNIGKNDEYNDYLKCDWTRQSSVKVITNMAARMGRTLMPLLQHHSYRPARPDYAGTSIAKRRLYKVRTGSADVFMTKGVQRDVNVELKILCDTSGSMDGERIKIVARSLLAIYHALNGRRGIDMHVAYFDDAYKPADDRDLRNYVTADAEGGTCLGMAIGRILQEYKTDKRRVLFVFTDGETCDKGTALDMIKSAARKGVELYGIGICTDILDDYDGLVHENVYELDKVPGVLQKMLREALLNKKAA